VSRSSPWRAASRTIASNFPATPPLPKVDRHDYRVVTARPGEVEHEPRLRPTFVDIVIEVSEEGVEGGIVPTPLRGRNVDAPLGQVEQDLGEDVPVTGVFHRASSKVEMKRCTPCVTRQAARAPRTLMCKVRSIDRGLDPFETMAYAPTGGKSHQSGQLPSPLRSARNSSNCLQATGHDRENARPSCRAGGMPRSWGRSRNCQGLSMVNRLADLPLP
jgi:hypothetical protein